MEWFLMKCSITSLNLKRKKNDVSNHSKYFPAFAITFPEALFRSSCTDQQCKVKRLVLKTITAFSLIEASRYSKHVPFHRIAISLSSAASATPGRGQPANCGWGAEGARARMLCVARRCTEDEARQRGVRPPRFAAEVGHRPLGQGGGGTLEGLKHMPHGIKSELKPSLHSDSTQCTVRCNETSLAAFCFG
jgi:hypothetical protein